ncbi:MAG: sigma factor [Oscillospiraceae bacterium]
MTNEELAQAIKDGHKELEAQLWERVYKFVRMQAARYLRKCPLCESEDLQQSGYFAMLAAVKYYNPERGFTYLTYLKHTLQKAFAEVAGLRGSTSPLFADSLNSTTYKDNTEEKIERLCDEDAQEALESVIYAESINYTADLLASALGLLDARQRRMTELIYYVGLPMDVAGTLAGYTSSSRQAASEIHKTIMFRLRNCSYTSKLRAALDDLANFDIGAEALKANGVNHFRVTWLSSTEIAAYRHIEHTKRIENAKTAAKNKAELEKKRREYEQDSAADEIEKERFFAWCRRIDGGKSDEQKN